MHTMFFFNSDVNVTLPVSVLHNGTLYAHVFLGPNDLSPLTASHRDKMAVVTVPLTKYLRPSATQFNLVTGDYEVSLTYIIRSNVHVHVHLHVQSLAKV